MYDHEKIAQLFCAVQKGEIGIVERLISEQVDVNKHRAGDKSTLLILATKRKNLHIMKLLLDADANINGKDVKGNLALHYAAADGYLEGVQLLVSRGILVNVGNIESFTPLMKASFEGHYEVADYLLKNGAQMLYQNHVDVVKLLLESADPSKDRQNELDFALVDASECDSLPVLDLLLKHGANPNFTHIPIFSAVRRKACATIDLLISHNADVNARDANGNTPLMCAIAEKRIDIVSRLIRAGADLFAKNEMNQKTVLAIAEEVQDKPILECIQTAIKFALSLFG